MESSRQPMYSDAWSEDGREKTSLGKVNCTRYALVVTHLLIMLFSIILMMLGVWVIAVPGTKHLIQISSEDLSMHQIEKLCYLVIAAGFAISIVSFLGCIGAFSNSKCSMVFVVVLMVVLILAEVLLGVLAIFYQDKIQQAIKIQMGNSLFQYKGDNKEDSISVAWTQTQKTFECCGVDTDAGYENHTNVVFDYGNFTLSEVTGSEWFRNSDSEDKEWPESCCKVISSTGRINVTACYDSVDSENINGLLKTGCADQTVTFIKRHFFAITALAILLIVVEVRFFCKVLA
ncbi:unnamed protein product [Clavelina lepadiformis]|uniref:Tetraspanin n=1 Tax=Clavelina lepadiformis TaxID=159417 RepID=A0ABP0GNG3_CLALP